MYEKRAESKCRSVCAHPPLIRVWWRPRGANQNEREAEWGRVWERENAVIRVFIWVDGVCKSYPGLAFRASVEVPVIRAVNECLKWVFSPRGGVLHRTGYGTLGTAPEQTMPAVCWGLCSPVFMGTCFRTNTAQSPGCWRFTQNKTKDLLSAFSGLKKYIFYFFILSL